LNIEGTVEELKSERDRIGQVVDLLEQNLPAKVRLGADTGTRQNGIASGRRR